MNDTTEITIVILKIVLMLTLFGSVALFLKTAFRKVHTQGTYAMAGIIVSSGAWTLATLLSLWIEHPIILETLYASSMLFSVSILWFVYVFPDNKPQRVLALLSAPAIIASVLSFIPGTLFNDFSYRADGLLGVVSGPGFFIVPMLFFIYLGLAISTLYSRHKETRNATLKQQLTFISFSIVAFTVIQLFSGIILSGFLGITTMTDFSPVFAFAYAFITIKIVEQYYYVDTKYVFYTVISKISLFLLAGVIYLIALLIVGPIARGHNVLTYHTAFLITLLLSLRIAPFFENAATKLAAGPREKLREQKIAAFSIRLFEEQYSIAEITQKTTELCKDIFSTERSLLITDKETNEHEVDLLEHIRSHDPDLTVEPTILVLETTAQSEIGVPTKREKLAEQLRNIYGASLIVTLSSQHTLYGLLLLSERVDKRGYSKQDINLIERLLVPLSSALAEATFRAKISMLTTSNDNEARKLCEQAARKNMKITQLLRTLHIHGHNALHLLRQKMDRMKLFGIKSLPPAEESLEKIHLEFDQRLTELEREQARPTVTRTDLSSLFHKLADDYKARTRNTHGKLTFELPETIYASCDQQQVYEAFVRLLDAMLHTECFHREYITFKVTPNDKDVEIDVRQSFDPSSGVLPDHELDAQRRCLSASDDSEVRAIIKRNGGTVRVLLRNDYSAETLITLTMDTSEDFGGLLDRSYAH